MKQLITNSLYFCLSVALTLSPSIALAQEEAKRDSSGSWTLSYGLVIMAVILGMMAICRPGKREHGDAKSASQKYEQMQDN